MSPLQRRSPSWRSSLPKLLHGQPVWWRGFLGVPQQWHERSLPGSAGQCLFYLALPPSGYRTVTKKIHDTCVSQTEPYHHGEDLWEGPAYFQPAVWLHSLPVLWKPDLLHRPLPGQGGGPEPHGAEVLSTGSSGPIWNHDNIACTEPSRSHLALRAGGATSVNLGSSGRWCQIPSSRSCIWWPWRSPPTPTQMTSMMIGQGVEMYIKGAGEQCGPEPVYGELHWRRWGYQRVPRGPQCAPWIHHWHLCGFYVLCGKWEVGRAALHTVLRQSPELAQNQGVSAVPKHGWWCLLAAVQTQWTGNPCAAHGGHVCQGDDQEAWHVLQPWGVRAGPDLQ